MEILLFWFTKMIISKSEGKKNSVAYKVAKKNMHVSSFHKTLFYISEDSTPFVYYARRH
jgi:hypothetical protein